MLYKEAEGHIDETKLANRNHRHSDNHNLHKRRPIGTQVLGGADAHANVGRGRAHRDHAKFHNYVKGNSGGGGGSDYHHIRHQRIGAKGGHTRAHNR